MKNLISLIPLLLIVVAVVLLVLRTRWNLARRAAFIRDYPLPRGLMEKLAEKHPGLSASQRQLVVQGLRQFFLAYLQGRSQVVSMPSQVVDDLWHEFILYTREYRGFCQRAFGRFLHHSPAAVLGSAKRINEGLRRVWWHACKQEGLNPRNASRLPLLFSLDADLALANGFRYELNCKALRQPTDDSGGVAIYCGSDFGNTSVDGGTAGFGDGHGAHDAHGGHSGLGSHGDSGGHGGHGGDGGGHGCGGHGCGGGGCSS